jgi:hypothetical protein
MPRILIGFRAIRAFLAVGGQFTAGFIRKLPLAAPLTPALGRRANPAVVTLVKLATWARGAANTTGVVEFPGLAHFAVGFGGAGRADCKKEHLILSHLFTLADNTVVDLRAVRSSGVRSGRVGFVHSAFVIACHRAPPSCVGGYHTVSRGGIRIICSGGRGFMETRTLPPLRGMRLRVAAKVKRCEYDSNTRLPEIRPADVTEQHFPGPRKRLG